MRRAIYNIFNTTPHFRKEPTKIGDLLVGLLAPNKCNSCGSTGMCLCNQCQELAISPPPPRCFGCQKVSTDYKTCQTCIKKLSCNSIVQIGTYDGFYKDLVFTMKFQSSRQAARDIGSTLSKSVVTFPHLSYIDIFVPVPTIQQHVRERSFDHTKTIVQQMELDLGVPARQLLVRTNKTRQLGQSRQVRERQMQNAVKMKEVKSLNGVEVLLIDDIATTGSTLAACARELKKAGAKKVHALVFAAGD